jgi:hypothetical protein
MLPVAACRTDEHADNGTETGGGIMDHGHSGFRKWPAASNLPRTVYKLLFEDARYKRIIRTDRLNVYAIGIVKGPA